MSKQSSLSKIIGLRNVMFLQNISDIPTGVDDDKLYVVGDSIYKNSGGSPTLIASSNGITFLGSYNASTNTPDAESTLVNNGEALIVSVAGTQTWNGQTYNLNIGDYVIRTTSGLVGIEDVSAIFQNITTETIPKVVNGALVDSSLREDSSKIYASKTLVFPQGSFQVGEAESVSELGGFLKLHSFVTDNEYTLVMQQIEGGSLDPLPKSKIFRFDLGTEINEIPQPDDSQSLVNVTTFDLITLNYGNQLNKIYMDFSSTPTNMRVEVLNLDVLDDLGNPRPIKYFPSLASWNGLESGIDIASTGKQEIYPLGLAEGTPFRFPPSLNLRFNIRADSSVDLKGNGSGIPYISVDVQEMTSKFTVEEDEYELVRDMLLALSGTERLDTSAIKSKMFTYTDNVTLTDSSHIGSTILFENDSNTKTLTINESLFSVGDKLTVIHYKSGSVNSEVDIVPVNGSVNGLSSISLKNGTSVTLQNLSDNNYLAIASASDVENIEDNYIESVVSTGKTSTFSYKDLSLPDFNVINPINDDTSEPTGFLNQSDSAILKSASSPFNSISLDKVASEYVVYIDGDKKVINIDKDFTFPDVEGIHYIYLKPDLSLASTQTFNADLLFRDNAYVSVVYWDATNEKIIYMGDERHGAIMDGVTHSYLHSNFGARYRSGLGLFGFTVDGDGSLDSHAQFQVQDGVIQDEDLIHNISNVGNPAQIPIYYLSGNGDVRRKEPDEFPLIGKNDITTTTRPKYNLFSGGVWTLATVPANYFWLVHYFATNDKYNPVIGWVGTQIYNNVSAARTGAATEINNLTGLPFAEYVPIGTGILKTDSYTNEPNATFVSTDIGGDYVDFRGGATYVGSLNPSDHLNLTNRSAINSHPASAISFDNSGSVGLTSTQLQQLGLELEGDILDHITSSTAHESEFITLTSNNFTATDVKGGLEENRTNTIAVQTNLDNHIASTEAHDAVNIDYDNTTSGYTATKVQGAIDEAITNLESHEASLQAHDSSDIVYDNTTTGYTATNSQDAIDEADGKINTNASNLTNHVNDEQDAHLASAIGVSEVALSTIFGSNAQSWINDADAVIEGHFSGNNNKHNASAVVFAPNGNITATDTQSAVVEVEGHLNTHVADNDAHNIKVNPLLKTVYVDKNGTDDSNTEGFITSPYLTINKAISETNTGRNIIHVNQGFYNEDVVIGSNSITLTSHSTGRCLSATWIEGSLTLNSTASLFRLAEIDVITAASSTALTDVSGSGGFHCYDGVYFASNDSTQLIKIADVQNDIEFYNCNINGRLNVSGTSPDETKITIIGQYGDIFNINNTSNCDILLIDCLCESVTNTGTGNIYFIGNTRTSTDEMVTETGSNFNRITNPYLTNLLLNYVDRSTNQSISGDKSFGGNTTLSGTVTINNPLTVNAFADFNADVDMTGAENIRLGGSFGDERLKIDSQGAKLNTALYLDQSGTMSSINGKVGIGSGANYLFTVRGDGDVTYVDNWLYRPVSGSTTLEVYDRCLIDTTSGAYTVYLPSTVSTYNPVEIISIKGGNALTIDGNGNDIRVYDANGNLAITDTAVSTTTSRNWTFRYITDAWELYL